MLSNTHKDANMQLTMNNFWPCSLSRFFPPTLPWLSVKSLTFPGFPDKWSPCLQLPQKYQMWQVLDAANKKTIQHAVPQYYYWVLTKVLHRPVLMSTWTTSFVPGRMVTWTGVTLSAKTMWSPTQLRLIVDQHVQRVFTSNIHRVREKKRPVAFLL